ncbi:MAG: metal ABC transporter ATP-binding protein [Nocardioides sp.]|uniref:metal ABC transporter ATP-binding protein n=1 Tax=Nocardioides sp. TaxID=35761 RepID=UPI0026147D09|nr:ABC transporter ATP-binding protein [Nocardioides sp.]
MLSTRTSPPTTPHPVVAVHDGGVVLGGRPVLRGIDLEVRAGEFVALLGANGSGKSTLVRAVTGLLPLARGEVRLFGEPQDSLRDRHRVGYVPQRATAASGVPASVSEVVAAGRLGHRRLLRPLRPVDRRAIADALDVVGLADQARDSVSSLSGGQQQRVLIARALAGQPELLILDEPTAGVDLPHQQALADALGTLKERGVTVLLVAHELGPLAPLVDRVVVVRHGRLAYDGPALAEAGSGSGHAPYLSLVDGHHHAHDHDHPGTGRAHRHDHAPHVAGPLDGSHEGGGRG